jgi:hypothetical protein
VASSDKCLGTSEVRVLEGEELNIWEEKLRSRELRGSRNHEKHDHIVGQKKVGIEASCSIV